MNRPLAILIMVFLLSLTLLSTVNGSTSIAQSFWWCGWNRAGSYGQVQINICSTGYGSSRGAVQFEVKTSNYASFASGGCNGGPCSNPTLVGVSANSFLILRFYPNYISGIQIIEPDSNGNIQQVWAPYNQINYYPNILNCDPYYQVCYSQNYCTYTYAQSCSAVIFRIAATPLTVNVFFSL